MWVIGLVKLYYTINSTMCQLNAHFRKVFQCLPNPIKMISFQIMKGEWETTRFKRSSKIFILLKFMCKLYGLKFRVYYRFLHLHTSTIIKIFFIDLFMRLKIFSLFFLHLLAEDSPNKRISFFCCFLTNCRLFSQWIDLFHFMSLRIVLFMSRTKLHDLVQHFSVFYEMKKQGRSFCDFITGFYREKVFNSTQKFLRKKQILLRLKQKLLKVFKNWDICFHYLTTT